MRPRRGRVWSPNAWSTRNRAAEGVEGWRSPVRRRFSNGTVCYFWGQERRVWHSGFEERENGRPRYLKASLSRWRQGTTMTRTQNESRAKFDPVERFCGSTLNNPKGGLPEVSETRCWFNGQSRPRRFRNSRVRPSTQYINAPRNLGSACRTTHEIWNWGEGLAIESNNHLCEWTAAAHVNVRVLVKGREGLASDDQIKLGRYPTRTLTRWTPYLATGARSLQIQLRISWVVGHQTMRDYSTVLMKKKKKKHILRNIYLLIVIHNIVPVRKRKKKHPWCFVNIYLSIIVSMQAQVGEV